eukprot:400354_1
MAALIQLLYILLTNDVVSGQAIVGEEYTWMHGVLYPGNNDNTIGIFANHDTSGPNLVEQLGTNAGPSLNGWYLESNTGVTLLTYWRTRTESGNIYWDYYTEPDIYPDSNVKVGHTMHFRATLTGNPTTSEPTQVICIMHPANIRFYLSYFTRNISLC